MGFLAIDLLEVQMLVEASVKASKMDSVQAILTVLGYKASQGGQATLLHLDGCW